MTTPFLGEIRAFGFEFAPKGWAQCNGQLLPINQNQALFALLGTTFGGDGIQTFALPNLQGRSPVHAGGGEGYVMGELVGVESVTVLEQEIPSHAHPAYASSASSGDMVSPSRTMWATTGHTAWSGAGPDTALHSDAIAQAGGGQPHENRSPFLTVTFGIALTGIFPSRN